MLAPRLSRKPYGWLTGQPTFMDAQVLRAGERDVSRGVVVRLPEGLLKIRRGIDVGIRLDKSQISWIEGLAEGVRLAMALIGLDEARRRPRGPRVQAHHKARAFRAGPLRHGGHERPLLGPTYGVISDGRLRLGGGRRPACCTRAMAVGRWVNEIMRRALEERAAALIDVPREDSVRGLYSRKDCELHLLGMLRSAKKIEELAARRA